MSELKVYKHWTEFPMAEWMWPNFSPEEMACRGTGKLAIDRRSMSMLQKLRNSLGAPMVVNSAYRSPEHNRAVGGATSSYHMKAMAFDVRMDNHNPQVYMEKAKAVGFKGIGQYADKGFLHVDSRDYPASFGSKNFPPSDVRYTPEPVSPAETDATPESVTCPCCDGKGVTS